MYVYHSIIEHLYFIIGKYIFASSKKFPNEATKNSAVEIVNTGISR